MLLAVLEVSLVHLTVLVPYDAFGTRHFVVGKASLVPPFIPVGVFAVSMLLPMHKFSLIA